MGLGCQALGRCSPVYIHLTHAKVLRLRPFQDKKLLETENLFLVKEVADCKDHQEGNNGGVPTAPPQPV